MKLSSDSREAIREHQAAKDHLERISRRDRTETAEYHAANQRVIDTEQRVSFFRR